MGIGRRGGGGELGTALAGRLTGQIVLLPRDVIDISDADEVREQVPRVGPDLVINAAAYNFVDRAESESERAYAVNALGPRHLAEICASLDIPLVHISTDYVFGSDADRREPYSEIDRPGPVSEYGRGKLAGEAFVQAACPKHYVLRTCGLYGRATSPGKGNFVETILRLGRERRPGSVVDDQGCTPTESVGRAG